jgi:mono/diheme cytochrome c family protein
MRLGQRSDARTLSKISIMISLVTVIVAAGYEITLVRRGFSARAEPSSLETLMATMARRLAVPSNYRQLHNPFQASPENIQAGMAHFADHCATCHANDGGGDTLFGKGLYPKPPDMRKAETQNKTDGELYYIVENGIRLSGMPAFGEHPSTTDAETWHLVTFIRHLPALTNEELEKMASLNPKTEQDRQEEQQEQEFLRGENPQTPGSSSHHR